MEAKVWTCPHHGTEQDHSTYCPQCLEWYETLPDPESMTGDERAAEFERWGMALTVPFDKMHKRLQDLVGRPIWTHEIGTSWKELVQEARERKVVSYSEAANKALNALPPEKTIVVVRN